MNVERDLLAAACDSRAAHSKILMHLGVSDLTDTGKMVWDVIDDYYCRDPGASKVNMETLEKLAMASVANPKHKETLRMVVEGLARSNLSGTNVVQSLIAVKREATAAKLSTALLTGASEQVGPLLEEYAGLLASDTLDTEEEDKGIVWGGNPVDDFPEDFRKSLIRVVPRVLNEKLGGGMMRGHHMIIFARPEMGKTSFLANLASGFLKQGLKVLYLGNEDPIVDVRLKMLGRVLEWPQERVTENMAQAYSQAMEHHNWGNLGLKQITPGSPMEIEALVREAKPDVVMIDQLRNLTVKGSKNDSMVQHLEGAAKGVRQIGIRNNCLMISTTQAGDSATGKGILDMHDVDSSKTGIPAQAEVLIGIGASRDDIVGGRRVLNLCKNKRTGLHDWFPVRVDFAISKYESMT